MDVNDSHPENAPDPIDVTEDGMFINRIVEQDATT